MDAAGAVTTQYANLYSDPGFVLAAGPRPLLVHTQGRYFSGAFLNGDNGPYFEVQGYASSVAHDAHAVSNGHDYLVTWTQSLPLPTGNVSNEIWAGRVNVNGFFTGAQIVIAAFETPGGRKAGQAIPIFDGKNYRIVYAAGTLGEAIVSDDSREASSRTTAR